MLPVVLSVFGSILPSIIDAFRSGKSPEEAASIIAPKRKELIDRLVGSGLAGPAAEAMADEAMKGELEKAQLPEAMNPLVMTALSVAGMFGGLKAGNMIKAGRADKLAKAVPAAAPTPAEVAMSGKTSPLPMSTDISNMGKSTDIRGMGATSDIRGMGSSTDINGMGAVSDIRGMGAVSDISNIGKSSVVPPSRMQMRAMSDPVNDIVPSYQKPVDTPFPPRDRLGGVVGDLQPLPGPPQVPDWVRNAPNPNADIVNNMVTKGPFPNRFVPPIDKRAEMQMAREELEAMLAQEQRIPRTPGTRLVAPWE